MDWYQRDPNTGRRKTIIRDDVAIKDFWVIGRDGNRIFVEKGTDMDLGGLPARYFTITCYGKTTTYKESRRQEMMDFYFQGMMACEGSERDRYTNIYIGLKLGQTTITDEQG